MAKTYLDDIIADHRARASRDAREWQSRSVVATGPSFSEAIIRHRPRGNAVIAEIKRASPSKGDLNLNLDPRGLAGIYESAGASAISVLTDEQFFRGSRSDLEAVRECVGVPILRKDFTVSINDVLDTAEMGASCVLLIAAALSESELREFLHVSREIGIDALVEVHDGDEALRAIDVGASIIGVNQRDLHTFAVDVERAEAVVSQLPSEVIRIAESGFHSASTVARAASVGFDAVLVGEAFVVSECPSDTVQEFIGHPIGGQR